MLQTSAKFCGRGLPLTATATAQWFNSSDADPETGQPAVLHEEIFTMERLDR